MVVQNGWIVAKVKTIAISYRDSHPLHNFSGKSRQKWTLRGFSQKYPISLALKAGEVKYHVSVFVRLCKLT